MRLFGQRPPSRSQLFADGLPPSSLSAHIASLHALLLHLGAEGDALAVGEEHLRQVAVFAYDRYRGPRWPR